MAVFDNLNYSYGTGVAPSVKDYWERTMLRTIEKTLIHCRDLQKRALPLHNGRRVTFRRMVPFAPITEPLAEGVTPAGLSLAMTSFTTTIKSYGRHVELTDELDWMTLDDMQQQSAKMLADQAAESIDLIARNALHSGLNVQYAGGNTSRAALEATDKLTFAEIKLAVRALKKRYAKKFDDGYYHGIVGPDTVHDLTADSMWVDRVKYQAGQKLDKYELGTIYDVKFFETPESMVFEPADYLYGEVASLTVTAWDKATRTITVSDTLTDHNTRNLFGKLVDIKCIVTEGGAAVGLTTVCIEDASTSKKIKLRWDPGDTITATWVDADNTTTIVPTGGGALGIPVHSTLIYGQDFAGCVELGGSGKNVRVIIKPVGSGGPEDPIDQRGTVAWKVKGFCVVILQDAFGVRIEHGVSA